MKAGYILIVTGLIAACAGLPARGSDGPGGWPDLIGPPLVLQDSSEAADIRVALARTSETVPALFRLTLSRAKSEMAAFGRDAEAEYAEFGDDPDYPWRPWSYDIVFEERYAREPVFSLLESKFTYTGGAHPNTDFDVINFDVRSGREFGLFELFGDLSDGAPVLAAMTEFTRRDLAAQKSERFGETVGEGDESLDVVTPTADTFRLFTLTPARDAAGAAGITVHFPPYAVGAYAEGSYEVFIPAEVFAPYLTPEYASLFGGEPVGLESVTNWEFPGALLLSASPRNGEAVSSPLALSGEAPSHWFFEGVAGVEVLDENGTSLGTGYVTWDTAVPTSGIAAGMVAYSGTVEFAEPTGQTGIVVISEDDPSDGEAGPVERVPIYVEFD
ncbi:Gmad2 immunoglobulin-like domain-containing protein [Microbaculum marinum]|uniref:Gmad2 immunoglobulin-like domain-containing protein n=1 Tax=Microbaculum marinum TaxID=1764581 RepID=A0AAW9RNG9_9HYPH